MRWICDDSILLYSEVKITVEAEGLNLCSQQRATCAAVQFRLSQWRVVIVAMVI